MQYMYVHVAQVSPRNNPFRPTHFLKYNKLSLH